MVVMDEMMSDCEKRNLDPVGPYLEKIFIDSRSVLLLDPRKKNHVGPDPPLHSR